MFEEFGARAAELYAEDWIVPAFELGWRGSSPRPHYAFDAAVRYVEGGPVVVLNICPAKFGPAAYAALPAALVHELICHVPSRPVGVIDNDSPFVEGFMDFAAELFLKRWIARVNQPLAAAALEHGEALRAALVHPAAGEPNYQRKRGRRAATELLSWLVGIHAWLPARAEVSVFILACRLNVVVCRLAFKDRLVARLLDPVPSWEPKFGEELLAALNGDAPPETLL